MFPHKPRKSKRSPSFGKIFSQIIPRNDHASVIKNRNPDQTVVHVSVFVSNESNSL